VGDFGVETLGTLPTGTEVGPPGRLL